MLYTDRIKNLTGVYPKLSLVWIKTDNPKMPLKGVWINEAKLRSFADQGRAEERECENRELAEDHLALAA